MDNKESNGNQLVIIVKVSRHLLQAPPSGQCHGKKKSFWCLDCPARASPSVNGCADEGEGALVQPAMLA